MAISGPPGAGATTLLREIVAALPEGDDVPVQVALAGARPEEVAEWPASGAEVVGGSFDRSPEAQAQAAELAVERAKRRSSAAATPWWSSTPCDALPPGRAGAGCSARAATTEEGGSLTVIAVTGDDPRPCAGPPRGSCSIPRPDAPVPQVSAASGTLRADRLYRAYFTTSVSAIVVGWTRHTRR